LQKSVTDNSILSDCLWLKLAIDVSQEAFMITNTKMEVLYRSEKCSEYFNINNGDQLNNYPIEKLYDNEMPQKQNQPVFLIEFPGKKATAIRYLQFADQSGNSGFFWILHNMDVADKTNMFTGSKELYRSLFAKSIEINKQLIETNEQLKRAQTRLIQQEKLASIGQLAAGVAHELNNPIGFVSSNFNTLKKYFNILADYLEYLKTFPSPESIIEYEKSKKIGYILEDITDLFSDSTEGVERITTIVQNLRRFSRVDFEHEIEPYDVNEGIKNTLVVARNEIKYVAEVILNLTDIPEIEAIGGEINQVFLNILVNAAQAIQSQQRKERATIKITTQHKDNKVVCEIEDDGPGIPKHIQSRIFDPFFTTKEVGKGTGLGLNISYDIIVNKHCGELIVDSYPGKGAKFIISLPLKFRNREEASETSFDDQQI